MDSKNLKNRSSPWTPYRFAIGTPLNSYVNLEKNKKIILLVIFLIPGCASYVGKWEGESKYQEATLILEFDKTCMFTIGQKGHWERAGGPCSYTVRDDVIIATSPSGKGPEFKFKYDKQKNVIRSIYGVKGKHNLIFHKN